jgi:DNA transformation protein and related proteins
LPTKIKDARNLGPKSAEWLADLGIHTLEDLEEKGVVATWKALQNFHEGANKNMLWAMMGAVMDLDWREIPIELKEQIKKELE